MTDEAVAVSSFDDNGQGIVSLEVDGQVLQILATLQPQDRLLGARVRAGQRLRIDDVNAAKPELHGLSPLNTLSSPSRSRSCNRSSQLRSSSGRVVVGFVLIVIPAIVASFLRNVEAGTIRLVSWLAGGTVIYRGPGKSKEIPLLTTGTTISSKVINVDLDITDQTADVDESGTPAPIKVRVLASAIVSVGDTDALIRTAANRFFSKSDADQLSTLTDLLSSSGRRAMNLLTHDQLFSAKAAPVHALPPGESAALVPVRTAADGARPQRRLARSRTRTIRSP